MKRSFWLKVFMIIATALLVVACVSFYQGLKGYKSVLPVESYVDKGIHEFKPQKVYVVGKRGSTYNPNRHARMRENLETKWMLRYKAVDGSGYAFKRDFGLSESDAREAKKEGNVYRRILVAKDENGKEQIFIAKAEDSIESYWEGKVSYYKKLLNIPIVYVFIYIFLLVRYIKYLKKSKA